MFLTLSYKYSVSVHKHVMVGGFWARYSKSDEKPDIYRCIYKYILDMWQLGTAARWDRFRKKIKS